MNPTPSTNPAIAVIAPAKNTPRHDRFLATTSPFTQAPARACGQPHIDLRHISTQKGAAARMIFTVRRPPPRRCRRKAGRAVRGRRVTDSNLANQEPSSHRE
ncbi:hypothetical protein GCM10009526_23360 [Glutamicibacter creatinolyticus]